jgi:hypothetical protein
VQNPSTKRHQDAATKKSREILAKHSGMVADKIEKISMKKSINSKNVEVADSTSSEPLVRVSKATFSICNRLGNYKELEKKVENNSIACLLKKVCYEMFLKLILSSSH